MLPNAKISLQKGGFSPEAASWTLIALFLTGAVGIQVVSRVLHHYIPSHVVDCDHTHEDGESLDHSASHTSPKEAAEHSPSHWNHSHQNHGSSNSNHGSLVDPIPSIQGDEEANEPIYRRPSFTTKVSQLVSNKKALCDGDGECYGYTDPCGHGCFKILQGRAGVRYPHPPLSRSATGPKSGAGTDLSHERRPLLLDGVEEEDNYFTTRPSVPANSGQLHQHDQRDSVYSSKLVPHANGHNHKQPEIRPLSSSSRDQDESHPEHHHHHVPTNAFLSIGLQTSIAIALHKLPEGFITYATNHANPKLGFSVFLALFVHNITEGFAMALPLYLAIKSRGKAMIWSSLLGGVSQPLGAAVAALWFRLAGSETGKQPSEGVYGGMFAIVGKLNISTPSIQTL
jgi:ZIP family zinc transporter